MSFGPKKWKRESKKVFQKRYKRVNLDKRLLLVGLIVIIISFFYKKFFFMTLLIVLNALVLSIERRTGFSSDIELSTFSAVLVTMAYGLKWGILIAISSKLIACFYNALFRIDHLFMIGGYIIAAIIAHLIPGIGPMWVGFIAIIVVNAYIYFISKYVTMLSDFEIWVYGMSNVIFNFLVFSIFANPLLPLMRIV